MVRHPPNSPPTRSARRANRYLQKAMRAACKGRFCAFNLWMDRAHAARRLRMGPNAIRGKSSHQLFRMLYFRDE